MLPANVGASLKVAPPPRKTAADFLETTATRLQLGTTTTTVATNRSSGMVASNTRATLPDTSRDRSVLEWRLLEVAAEQQARAANGPDPKEVAAQLAREVANAGQGKGRDEGAAFAAIAVRNCPHLKAGREPAAALFNAAGSAVKAIALVACGLKGQPPAGLRALIGLELLDLHMNRLMSVDPASAPLSSAPSSSSAGLKLHHLKTLVEPDSIPPPTVALNLPRPSYSHFERVALSTCQSTLEPYPQPLRSLKPRNPTQVLSNNQLGADARGTFGGAAGRLPDDCFGLVLREGSWRKQRKELYMARTRGGKMWRFSTITIVLSVCDCARVCFLRFFLCVLFSHSRLCVLCCCKNVPRQRWCHGLTSLDVSNNPDLQTLPSSLGHLARLEALNASHCSLARVTTKLWACSSLTRLELQVGA
jgi:hypothetical protein